MRRRRWLAVLALTVTTCFVLHTTDAWARASKGGSRGSRSYSAPAQPGPVSPSPSSPSRRDVTSNPANPAQPSRPGFLGGFGGMLGGLLLGGLIGGLLFGGLGGGFGIGLMDILLLGGIAFLIIAFLRRRRAPEPAYSMAGGGSMTASPQAPAERGGTWSAATAVAEPTSAATTELERGLGHIRSMDARFDPDTVAADARGTFRDVQAAVMARDAAPLRSRLTPEMANILQNQCDRLRSSRQTNKLERIDVRRAEITEAWQEGGQDFVTVYLAASLLDYTVDDRTGSVLDGSSTVPQEIEEYWTFTRPVGPNPWRLSAIQTG